MGREAVCTCRWGKESGEAKVLLESTELILRGALKRKIALSALRNLAVHEDSLIFTADGDHVELELGAQQAAKWLAAMQKPPATLADKLGLSKGGLAYQVGTMEDAQLLAALSGATTDTPAHATLMIGYVENDATLTNLRKQHADRTDIPLWVAFRKGAASPFGETPVRAAMREHGYIDVKVAGVSAALSALKFTLRDGKQA
ncbi:MAG TPA: hypothetical protein VIT92_09840 [Burkholderiaceae bacterium]